MRNAAKHFRLFGYHLSAKPVFVSDVSRWNARTLAADIFMMLCERSNKLIHLLCCSYGVAITYDVTIVSESGGI